jgi:hypothetical protein
MRATRTRVATGIAVVAGAAIMAASPASAHVHTVNDGPIANGQHHPVFTSAGGDQGTSCDTSAGPGGAQIGAAWYGLETAHHGPDTGTAGKGRDGCYQTTVVTTASGAVVPAYDTNPAID